MVRGLLSAYTDAYAFISIDKADASLTGMPVIHSYRAFTKEATRPHV